MGALRMARAEDQQSAERILDAPSTVPHHVVVSVVE